MLKSSKVAFMYTYFIKIDKREMAVKAGWVRQLRVE